MTGVALLLGLFCFILFVLSCIGFVVWAFREHYVACQFRKLVKMYHETDTQTVATSGPRWRITYKARGKTLEKVVEGATEAAAMLAFVKQEGVGYSTILSCDKV